MTPVPTADFWREFWQLDLFGSRAGVTVKKLGEGWSPAGYEELPESGPFRRQRRSR